MHPYRVHACLGLPDCLQSGCLIAFHQAKGESPTRMEPDGQLSTASCKSASSSASMAVMPWFSSPPNTTKATPSSSNSKMSGAASPHAPQAMHVSLSTLVYLATGSRLLSEMSSFPLQRNGSERRPL